MVPDKQMFYCFFFFNSCTVFLYGEAATSEYRKTVPQIRAGEYEGLAEKVPELFQKILYVQPHYTLFFIRNVIMVLAFRVFANDGIALIS